MMSNTETISPAGLEWENVSTVYWVLHSHGYYSCFVNRTPAGYCTTVSGVDTYFDDLETAMAVATALIAMRGK